MKKCINSDWLRAVQFMCNTSAESVTWVQLHMIILDCDLLKGNETFSKPMISIKTTQILYGNFEKRFSQM